MADLMHDVRLALRSLLRRPGFTAVAVLTLALGTSVNATVFGLLNEVVLRPLPFPEPDRLVSVTAAVAERTGAGLSVADAAALGRTSRVFEAVGWVERPSLSDALVLTGATPERVAGAWVSASFFGVLGVRPALGRLFRAGEDLAGAERVALLEYGAWLTRWGGDPAVVGRTLEVNGAPVTIVGVLPASFEMPLGGGDPVLWVASAYEPWQLESREFWIAEVVARLRPGATVADAERDLAAYASDVRARYPEDHADTRFVAEPLHAHWVGEVREPLLYLFAGAVLVLLVACANLGILVAARNEGRQVEIAVRQALGAGHARLARAILTESLVLAVAGTGLGLLLSLMVSDAVHGLAPMDLPRAGSGGADGRFLAFGAVIAVSAGLIVGLAPTARALRRTPGGMLRSRGRGREAGLSRLLVGAECAAVLALLLGSGLAARGLAGLLAVDPGFSTAGRVVARVTLPTELTWRAEGGLERSFAFFSEARRRIEAMPGIRAAGFVSNPPLTPASWGGRLYLRGEANDAAPVIDWEVAGAGYFEAAGIELVAGRGFTERDDADAPPVAIVNETLARRYLPAGRELGTVLTGETSEGPWRTVVGIVRDVKQQSLGQSETRPQMYIHDLQGFAFDMRHLVYHAPGDALAHVDAVRQTLREVHPGVALDAVAPLSELVTVSAATARFHALLLGLFAGVATLLGLAGVYGVVSDGVQRRRGEIAVRMALGADRGRVLRAELLRGLKPVASGALCGLLFGLAGARVARGEVAGMESVDPGLVVGLCFGLLGVSALAVLAPARRAAATPPAAVLRED